jgi:hypothetical protein
VTTQTGNDDKDARRPLRGLPRVFYWVAGSIIALSGALLGRIVAAQMTGNDRIMIWAAASAIIFIGLGVLSLGTRHRRKVGD